MCLYGSLFNINPSGLDDPLGAIAVSIVLQYTSHNSCISDKELYRDGQKYLDKKVKHRSALRTSHRGRVIK